MIAVCVLACLLALAVGGWAIEARLTALYRAEQRRRAARHRRA